MGYAIIFNSTTVTIIPQAYAGNFGYNTNCSGLICFPTMHSHGATGKWVNIIFSVI